ncbi:MAG: amidohydrolase [Mailhella sp.]|nr:amidohydrolase [Mailhella sp.]
MSAPSFTVLLGHIHTMDESQPVVGAACASNGRVVCMGTREEVLDFASAGQYEVIDASQYHVYPGFIDSHSHLSGYSSMINDVFCGLSCGSIENILALLKKRAEEKACGWVLGYGYDDTGLPECRHLTRAELDEVSRDKPVLVRHVSLHFAYANSLAMKILGFDAGTKIDGGEIELDGQGMPTGLLTETAAFRAFAGIPTPSLEQTKANIVKAMAEYNRQGITAFVDSGIGILGDAETVVKAYAELAREGKMTARGWLQATSAVIGRWQDWYDGATDDYLRLGGLKLFADGSIQAFTAALFDDYFNLPGCRGTFVDNPELMQEKISSCNAMGVQVAVHCNGDAAIEAALCAFEKAFSERPRPELHHTIVHAQMASFGQLERMKACGVLPTLFPIHIDLWGDRHLKVFLGSERASRLSPAGDCVRLGLPFGLHVDTPIARPAVLRNIHHAVNRRTSGGVVLGKEQSISSREGLKAYTSNGALFCQRESECGVIRLGSFADFVCLDEEIETAAPEAVGDIRVRMTLCGGLVVFSE